MTDRASLADALQYVWSQLYGQHVIAPSINAARTWEGLVGGSASTALVGMVLCWATPFPDVWQAAFMSMVIAVMGFAGAMTMSAIKRDRGVNDYGTLVEGHGGVLDRIDSICFAAPVFYHVTRHLFGSGNPLHSPAILAERQQNSPATCRTKPLARILPGLRRVNARMGRLSTAERAGCATHRRRCRGLADALAGCRRTMLPLATALAAIAAYTDRLADATARAPPTARLALAPIGVTSSGL